MDNRKREAGCESTGQHGDNGALGYSNTGPGMTIYEDRKGIKF